ncbi:hypothetical protein ACFQ2B_35570 [Streptomyces stramineus]
MTSVVTDAKTRATGGGALARQRRRTALLSAAALAVLVVLTAIGLGTGEVSIPPVDALRGLVGLGDAGNVMLVQELRAPASSPPSWPGRGWGSPARSCSASPATRSPRRTWSG